MSNGVQISIPMGDVNRLFDAMQYASEKLNISTGKAMKQAVRHLFSSIGASTRVAPKERKVIERPPRNLEQAAQQLVTGEKNYAITGWFGKPRTFQTRLYTYKDISKLKKTHALIKRRGLAKTTWKMAARKMKGAVSESFFDVSVNGITNKIASRHSEGSANYTGNDIFAEIHNSLPYINQAMKAGGKRAVDTAFDRAARGLLKSVDKQVERRLLKAA